MRQHLRRPCKKCNEMFRPTGKYTTMCDKCKRFLESNKRIRMWIKKGEVLLKKNHKNLLDKKNIYLKDELRHLNKIIERYIK